MNDTLLFPSCKISGLQRGNFRNYGQLKLCSTHVQLHPFSSLNRRMEVESTSQTV